MRTIIGAALLASAGLCAAGSATAQDATLERTDAEWQAWVPAIEEVSMPELAFVEDQDDRDNYEKYYFFYRPDTQFTTALTDLRECDARARGLFRPRSNVDTTAATLSYGLLPAAVGGIVGNMIADAIYGSQQVRTNRRVNMRRCMFYKGYERHGLDKELWEEFNFEEGNDGVPEDDRQMMLAQQALVAATANPQTQDLGL